MEAEFAISHLLIGRGTPLIFIMTIDKTVGAMMMRVITISH